MSGKPKGYQRLTAKETVFVDAMARTGDKAYSRKEAGYTHAQTVDRMMRKQHIVAEIRRREQDRLFQEGLPAAVQCVVEIVRNSSYAPGARVQAAKVIFDRTLGTTDGEQGKELHEMTAEELATAIEKLEREASTRAKTINPEPVNEPDVFE